MAAPVAQLAISCRERLDDVPSVQRARHGAVEADGAYRRTGGEQCAKIVDDDAASLDVRSGSCSSQDWHIQMAIRRS
jgi:hypothetical protein